MRNRSQSQAEKKKKKFGKREGMGGGETGEGDLITWLRVPVVGEGAVK